MDFGCLHTMLFPKLHALTPPQIGINVPESTEQEDHQHDVECDGDQQEQEEGEPKEDEAVATVEIENGKGEAGGHQRDIPLFEVDDIPMFPKYTRREHDDGKGDTDG